MMPTMTDNVHIQLILYTFECIRCRQYVYLGRVLHCFVNQGRCLLCLFGSVSDFDCRNYRSERQLSPEHGVGRQETNFNIAKRCKRMDCPVCTTPVNKQCIFLSLVFQCMHQTSAAMSKKLLCESRCPICMIVKARLFNCFLKTGTFGNRRCPLSQILLSRQHSRVPRQMCVAWIFTAWKLSDCERIAWIHTVTEV